MRRPPVETTNTAETESTLGWDPVTHYLDPGVAASYDSERFNSIAGKVYQRLERHALLAAFHAVPRTATVLDLPCGTGRLAEHLLAAGYRVVGADISGAMLEQAQIRLERFGDRFATTVCDAREVGRLGTRFDAALCARVLLHFPLSEQIEFLSGVAAGVNRFVVITHSLDARYQRLRRQVKRLLRHQPSVGYPITEQDLQHLLAAARLREVGRWRVNRFLSEAIIVLAEKLR